MEWNPGCEFVKFALEIGAMELISEGRQLKSGRISPYFFNSALFTNGQSLAFLAESYKKVLLPFMYNVEVLYGPPYKGTTLASILSQEIWRQPARNIGFSSSRKEAKLHGEGGKHIGHPHKNKAVVIIDDVITTGSSSSEAVEYIKSQGGYPIGFIIAFDREERGERTTLSATQEFSQEHKIPVYSVSRLTDLIAVLKEKTNPTKQEQLALVKILEYQATYGV